ncbi:MAG: four helix bundle protein [Elusimicrobia bacterium]|nr:four helix bundle protein [Elusimicrobiota bacterium]
MKIRKIMLLALVLLFSGAANRSGIAGFNNLKTWIFDRRIAATSNDIDNLPAELLRKGRFDEIFFADLPTLEEKKEIFKIHILKRDLNLGDFDLNLLAEASNGFSGAEIEQAVISIASNIAEGAARGTAKDKMHFCYYSSRFFE